YSVDYGNWNLKLQYTTYDMSPKNSPQITDPDGKLIPNPIKGAGKIEMAAYGANNYIATKADTYVADISYTIPINKGILDDITIYNDFGWMHKRIDGMKDSYQNVTGALFHLGPVFTYLDYAVGKNHSWLGKEFTNALAEGGADPWGARLNLNIGYYF